MEGIDEFLSHLMDAELIARKAGIFNPFGRGRVQEIVMATVLGHELVPGVDGPDAKLDGKFFEYKSKLLPAGRFEVDIKPDTWHDTVEYYFFGIFKSWIQPVEIRRITKKVLLRHSKDGVHCAMKLGDVRKFGITFFDITRPEFSLKHSPGAVRFL